MHPNLNEFIYKLAKENVYSIYHLLESDAFNLEETAIADKLKIICTSFFMRERQSKLNSLFKLKEHGFYPSHVIDVGAQIGTPELYQVFPESHHVFIEPVKECIPTLNEIAKQLSKCTIYNCAISNSIGLTNLSLTTNRQYSSIELSIGEELRVIEVKTIDSILKEIGSFESILIKIDVDGIELKVLEGSISLLQKECVIVIEATLGDQYPRFNILVEYLSNFGYKVFDIIDPLYRPRDWHLWQVDLVFIHENSSLWNHYSY